ncbi:hypothetical protein NGM07_02685 [Halorussus vallis]|uniref:hypothetical protein n=2 Tax=Halorussus TaxID=1070314 RepID=UPI0020A03008|nr:hypothetical protein [Halorussus vallis]USZ76240.1 hypothetical protein NGM07_02685 [Halorussus vallis]
MPLKRSNPATDFEEIDRWDGGVGWIAHPDESMERASHALAVDGAVWVVDPVDAPDVDDLVGEFGEVEGVVVLLNRHYRDADRIARRHDVPVYVPSWFDRPDDVTAPVRGFENGLPESDYRLLKVVDSFGWQEAALYDGETGTLVVPEAVGTAPFFRAKGERLGVHPMLRLTPPRVLRGFRPERVLVGHGRGILDGAGDALSTALGGARRRAPGLFVRTVRALLTN